MNEPNKKATFKERVHCINCNSDQLTPVWHGKYLDEPIRTFIHEFHYNADLEQLLSGESFSLVKCDKCNMLFHKRILTPHWLDELYSKWITTEQIEKFEAAIKKNNHKVLFEKGRQWLKHGIRLNHLLSPVFSDALKFRVLDFGCGDARFISSIALLGFETYGIDFSVTRKSRSNNQGVKILSNLSELDSLNIEKFHAITLFQTLEHVEEPLSLLKNLATRMQKNGILIIEVPNCHGIDGPPVKFEDFHNVQPLEHINNFTPSTLSDICKRAGFLQISRPPAHLTSKISDVLRTEASRFIQPKSTNQYFRLL